MVSVLLISHEVIDGDCGTTCVVNVVNDKTQPLRGLLDVTLESLQQQDVGLSILFASTQRASSFIHYFWELYVTCF